ncbi:MAG TPA: acyl-CoA dehydrogenase family protein [Jatrophihabitans sp.]|jgi:alkylation response protein AidB-like acyl-CoA dehydrogenase|uniref:acyl-CoA dehydrogenase family protein n=1 Tax=Jatrophihabitans sp. TaxID=1932789 RepID=UPI002EE693F0
MSAFALTDEQRAYVRQVREVAVQSLVPLAEQGVEGRVNRPLLEAMGSHGLLSRLFGPTGRSAAAMELCLLRETLATVCTDAETALALQALGSYPFVLFGNEPVAERYREGVAAGTVVASFALSEAEAGSDAAALGLRAEPEGEGWRLTGEKTWISNAPEADVYTVFARTTADARARGITAFVVAGNAPGLTGQALDMLAPHAIGRLTFDGVRVERADVLGEVDAGFKVAMRTLDVLRPSVGAFAVGMAQAALDAAIEHTTSRQAFGGVLSDQQAVSHLLAEMATRVEASRLLVYAAAAAYDAGAAAELLTRKAAMAKLFATESAQFVVDAAVQLHGARALQRGHLLERLYRDVRAPRIYEGASEVQRTIIGRSLTQAATSERAEQA